MTSKTELKRLNIQHGRPMMEGIDSGGYRDGETERLTKAIDWLRAGKGTKKDVAAILDAIYIYINPKNNGWLPLSTAPLDESILLLWKGITDRREVICAQISSIKKDTYWNGESYLPIRFVTHWQPLPSALIEEKKIHG